MGEVESNIHDSHHNSPTRPRCLTQSSAVQDICMRNNSRCVHIGYTGLTRFYAQHLRITRKSCQPIGTEGNNIDISPTGLNLTVVPLQSLRGGGFNDGAHKGRLMPKGRRLASFCCLLNGCLTDV